MSTTDRHDSGSGGSGQRPSPVRNLISKKKEIYPVSDFFGEYLERYGRLHESGVRYENLLRYDNAVALYDEHGNDTLWSTVFYGPAEMREINEHLRLTYALLKSDGDLSTVEHLFVDRIDLCLYGNTLPFRVRIVNRLNENFDYFYVKRVDANRLYGLELEHILSPNRINYFISGQTLIEEHIIGIPGDAFMRETMPENRFDQVRLAKEFVKFNERCFVRLLGDMHSGNFVIDITPDFEKMQYRMRPLDFDQQSHHWRKQVYLPQFYPQNNAIIAVGMEFMGPTTVDQYQREERALIANRLRVSHGRYHALMDVMREDLIAPAEHVQKLGRQLADHYHDDAFAACDTMGELVHASLERLLQRAEPASASLLNFPVPTADPMGWSACSICPAAPAGYFAVSSDMNWRDYIVSDPRILVGKPTLKGTRISVKLVLELLGAGWTQEEVLENYPTLTPEMLRAAFAYAAEAVQDETVHPAA